MNYLEIILACSVFCFGYIIGKRAGFAKALNIPIANVLDRMSQSED
jgi:hypothetical protein